MLQAENGFVFQFDPPVLFVNSLNRDIEVSCTQVDRSLGIMPQIGSGEIELGTHTKTEFLSPSESFQWCSITSDSSLAITIRLMDYPWAQQKIVSESRVLSFEFSRRGRDSVCILAEVVKVEGIFKITVYSQYSIENFTSLPMMF
jgi:hypothetical protein